MLYYINKEINNRSIILNFSIPIFQQGLEFVDYKLTLSMIRTTNDNYIILTSKENIVAHTRYVVKDNDPNIMIKVKRSKSKQNVSLKK